MENQMFSVTLSLAQSVFAATVLLLIYYVVRRRLLNSLPKERCAFAHENWWIIDISIVLVIGIIFYSGLQAHAPKLSQKTIIAPIKPPTEGQLKNLAPKTLSDSERLEYQRGLDVETGSRVPKEKICC